MNTQDGRFPLCHLHRNLSDKNLPFRAAFVVSIPPCRNNSGKISLNYLESGKSRRTFAVANKLQRRVKAAAQQSSNKFGSAFTLHFTCIVNQTKQVLGDANKRINKINNK